MKMIFFLILSVTMTLYAGIIYYIGRWMWKHLGNKLLFINGKVYWVIIILFAIVSLIGMGGNHYFPGFLREGIYLVANYWFTSVLYLSLIIVIVEVISKLDKWTGFIPKSIKNNSFAPYASGSLVLIVVVILLVFGTLNARNLQVTSYEISIDKQAGSLKQLRVVFLADMHLSSLEDKAMGTLVKKINQLNPDIVLISGDMIDSNLDTGPYELLVMEEYFKKIKSKYGIYASLGNHDYDYTGDSQYRIERFNQAGVNILRDSSVKIDDSFYLIGREDISYKRISGNKRNKLSNLVEELDMKLPVIVLDHQPIGLEESRATGVDLQLSGHTHKGQLFPINFITNKIFEIDYGYLNKGGLQNIVTSGSRTWGPPIRVGSPSEVVLLTINFK